MLRICLGLFIGEISVRRPRITVDTWLILCCVYWLVPQIRFISGADFFSLFSCYGSEVRARCVWNARNACEFVTHKSPSFRWFSSTHLEEGEWHFSGLHARTLSHNRTCYYFGTTCCETCMSWSRNERKKKETSVNEGEKKSRMQWS